jgi:hypothetical protein
MAINDMDFARFEMSGETASASTSTPSATHPYWLQPEPRRIARISYQSELVLVPHARERIRAPCWTEYDAATSQSGITSSAGLRTPAKGGLDCTGSPALSGFEWMQVSGAVQADYTVRAFAYADRYWPWVGPMFLWNLNWQMYDYEIENACSHLRWFGLLEHDGAPTVTYRAVAAMPRRVSAYLPQWRRCRSARTGWPCRWTKPACGRSAAAFCPRARWTWGSSRWRNSGWPAAITFLTWSAELTHAGRAGRFSSPPPRPGLATG